MLLFFRLVCAECLTLQMSFLERHLCEAYHKEPTVADVGDSEIVSIFYCNHYSWTTNLGCFGKRLFNDIDWIDVYG